MSTRSPGIVVLVLSWLGLGFPLRISAADPLPTAADRCDDAPVISNGSFAGNTDGADSDGAASCGGPTVRPPDVWFRYAAPADGTVVARIVDAAHDSLLSVLSVHTACPGTRRTEIACNSEGQAGFSSVAFEAEAGEEFLIRVSGDHLTGSFLLEIDLGGVVSGAVTRGLTGEPLAGAFVNFLDESGHRVTSARADDGGEYVAGVLAGTYFATASSGSYLPEVYEERPCLLRSCEVDSGTPIEVSSGTTVSGIDFTLDLGSVIAGTVKDAVSGDTLRGVEVNAWDRQGRRAGGTITAGPGVYLVSDLPAGTYYVATENTIGYHDELFADVPCPGGPFMGCDLDSGTPIEVAAEATVSGVDFALDPLGAISGTVVAALGGQPIAGVEIDVISAGGETLFARGRTDASGAYVAGGLEPGTYLVMTQHVPGFVAELYDDVPCPRFLGCMGAGRPVEVAFNAVTAGVDFRLSRPGLVTGTVTEEATGEPIAGIEVHLFAARGGIPASGLTDAEGRYAVETFSGTYFARTSNRVGYFDELYDDIPCGHRTEFTCMPSAGTPIEVALEQTTTGIDFALNAACQESSTALCLKEGRFQVEAAWEDPSGHRGPGRPTQLTVDSGYFWFFSQDNVELVVKLLDGCFDPFDSFWFFAAGLTDVAVEITVTDVPTGAVKRYRNPLGRAFEPILDTAAFATCDAVARHQPAAPRRRAASPSKGSEGPACSPGSTGLCLNEGRFLVEAFWRTPQDLTGEGHPVVLTADTGFFWFFSSDNLEVVVKVLDGCEIEPFHSFWVFTAGLTNVEVTLRVTDTVSGAVREYKNPLGRSFRPVLDTSAFATCPE